MGVKKIAAGMLLAAFTAVAPMAAEAQTTPAPASVTPISANSARYVSQLHLAYIRTSSADMNSTAQDGLTALAHILNERTSVEPAGVVGLNIEQDELSLFPFIYWPVEQNAQPLSAKAQQKVQQYIDNGGVILFDVPGDNISTGNTTVLKRMLGNVMIKPLVRMEDDHTLTQSFYMVAKLPGSNNYGSIWVETPGAGEQESVSSVVVGSNGWASAWAGKTLPYASKEREMALRAGVNFVFYALTGDYKSDQIHKPSLKERRELNGG